MDKMVQIDITTKKGRIKVDLSTSEMNRLKKYADKNQLTINDALIELFHDQLEQAGS